MMYSTVPERSAVIEPSGGRRINRVDQHGVIADLDIDLDRIEPLLRERALERRHLDLVFLPAVNLDPPVGILDGDVRLLRNRIGVLDRLLRDCGRRKVSGEEDRAAED